MDLAPYLLLQRPLRLPARQRRAGRRRGARWPVGPVRPEAHGRVCRMDRGDLRRHAAGPGRAGPAQPPACGGRDRRRPVQGARSHPCRCRSARARPLFDTDEGPRRDTSARPLAGLKPAFKEGGTVTAGNAPGITDGAAALVLARRSSAERGRAQAAGASDRVCAGPSEAARGLHRAGPRRSPPVRAARLPPRPTSTWSS